MVEEEKVLLQHINHILAGPPSLWLVIASYRCFSRIGKEIGNIMSKDHFVASCNMQECRRKIQWQPTSGTQGIDMWGRAY